MQFVDTHCHLNLDVFQNIIEQVVERAQELGVNKIVVPGIDIDTSRKAVELASKFNCVYAAVGIHPNEVDGFEQKDIKTLEDMLRFPKVVAVGEVGLDFHYCPDKKPQQLELLEAMLFLATDNNKPVILHSRNSLDELLIKVNNWIKSQHPLANHYFGVFHGFEGNASQAREIQSMNMAIGVGGPVTFKNAHDKQLLVTDFGIKNVVLETDSPLLSPHPFRGQTNEPFRIPLIAEKIASLLQTSLKQVSELTTRNAQFLFRWDEIN